MKARTSVEKSVESLSRRIKPLTLRQRKQAEDCLTNEAWWDGHKVFCTCCGHKMDLTVTQDESIVCPDCGRRLKVVRTRKRNDKEYKFMAINTICGGWQVVRIVEAFRKIARGSVETGVNEVVRFWISENGRHLTQTIRYGMMNYNVYWKYGTEMELRKPCFSVNFYVDKVYDRQNVLKVLRRNGYMGKLHGFTPLDVFTSLLTEPMFETLWKVRMYEMLRAAEDTNRLKMSWPAIRIVLRNRYRIKDFGLWFDTVSMMLRCGMDITNKVYVCAKNIKEVHEVARLRCDAIERKKEQERVEEDIKKVDKSLRKKEKFFGVSFTANGMLFKTLSTGKEYYDEGKEMHHCVWSSEYYKQNSLIISVRSLDDMKRLATVELSIETFKILQCRAMFNEVPERADEIEGIVNENVYRFMMCKNKKLSNE